MSSVSDLLSSVYNTTPATSIASSATQPPAAQQNLAQEATALASQGDVVVSLTGASSSSSLTYSATDLFNSLAQSGTDNGSTTSLQSLDQSVTNSLYSVSPTAASNAAGIYSAVAAQTGSSLDVSSLLADALKQNPALAGAITATSLSQGIISILA